MQFIYFKEVIYLFLYTYRSKLFIYNLILLYYIDLFYVVHIMYYISDIICIGIYTKVEICFGSFIQKFKIVFTIAQIK